MFPRNKGLALLIACTFLFFFAVARTFHFNLPRALRLTLPAKTTAAEPPAAVPKSKPPAPAPVRYGIPTDSLETVTGVVAPGENISDILTAYQISLATIQELAQKARPVFNVRRLQAQRNYTLLHARDSARTARYFIYEPNDTEYIIYDLRGDLAVTRHEREVKTIERELAGEIEGSLYESVLAAGGTAPLVNKLADIYAWRLNLHQLQPGDRFKLIFEEKQVNGNLIGYGALKAAFFEHNGRPLYAIGFDQGQGLHYFDQEGKSFKKAFLKEPLEYTRISSRYNKNRFHPVQKRYKAHLGTDFAAPRGTPIRSVGEGVVTEAGYARGNGYYVKIRHNQTYATQYLHLSRFGRGVRRGARVVQEQTIGYVGSTGLSTGPHLCYRLWKNGKQVDALRVKLPLAEPVRRRNRAAFTAAKAVLIQRLEALPVPAAKPELLAADKVTAVRKS